MRNGPTRTAKKPTMLGHLPRRFRSRVLLVILLTGTTVLVVCHFTSTPDRSFNNRSSRDVQRSSPSVAATRWWSRWWTVSEKCRVDKPVDGRVVDTADVYPDLDFKMPDTKVVGFWSEALEKRYREIRNTWKNLPLEVIVMPHSHTDPGWLRTYDDYFEGSVSHILDNMVNFLNKIEDFRFIWSEISYFSTWWNRQNEEVRATVGKILRRNQLEFVTGGWVMTDEATTSYFSIIDQLIEGHQWLSHHTNVTPHRGWSVDVFGHSASLPYVLSLAGITDMVILRIHYSWKAYMAKMKWFDFYWDQPFNSPKILCHMAPSALYSFKHTCGPDPVTCLNYDFRKVGGEMSESTADFITDGNVELKSKLLLSQYGRYASLSNHNVLLVPLGDDFRYNIYSEWEQQYTNYKKLFNYINGRKEWNAHVRFGTLADYFDEVHNRMERNISSLPSIRGDFFPYADIYANARPSYWTGYYTTRPFYKKLAQELEYWLRSSEILYSFAKTIVTGNARNILLKDYAALISARQTLGLFQHHDAITGTSKQYVMTDYGQRLHSGITNAMSVTSHTAQILLLKMPNERNTWTSQVYPDVYKTMWNYPIKEKSISATDKGRKIILFNSLTFERTETIRLKVKSPTIKVEDLEGRDIPSQLNPTWTDSFAMSNSVFELIFVVTLKPLSFSTFNLVETPESKLKGDTRSVVSLYLKDNTVAPTQNAAFKFEKPKDSDINIESPHFLVKFSPSGILKEVYSKETGISKSIDIDFSAYLPWLYRSGAYLFQPDTPRPIPLSNLTDNFPMLCVVRGPIVTELNIMYSSFFKFTVLIYHFKEAPPGLQLEVSPDLAKLGKDIELIMRIKSDIKNGGVFFTDSNGLQILKRNYVDSLPVQGNYYPATSAMYVEDKTSRLTLLIPHSHGVTSLEPGMMEVMIDRRMRSDDGRGMGEGVQDNLMITTTFWLIPESVEESRSLEPFSLSSGTRMLSLRSHYPVITLITDSTEAEVTHPDLAFLSQAWPSDVHLVNLRTLSSREDFNIPSNSSLMVVHELYDPCKTQGFVDSVIESWKTASFSNVKLKTIEKTPITGTVPFKNEKGSTNVESFSKLQACKVTFS